ncbi:hypothetical protein MBLNU230_g4157t1 [Neophaeotheca triangularis]
MTSAIPPNATSPSNDAQAPVIASSTASGTTSPLPGAVPAQPQARSYASAATKTASHAPSASQAGASAPQQNAKQSTESPVNGSTQMQQGGSMVANSNGLPNGTSSHSEHAKKPSVVINASGATGSTTNGGPVSSGGSRPNINFGSMNAQDSPSAQASAPYQPQNASLSTPARDPRVTSPAHSPSPIPAPSASGGRPPSMSQAQSNGLPNFGSMAGDNSDQRQTQMLNQGPLAPGMQSEHMRRTSSQSMHGDMSNPGMQMRNSFTPQGRGRGFAQPPYNGMPSPSQAYRQPAQPYRGSMPPSSPYQRNAGPIQPQQQHYPGFQEYHAQHQGASFGQPPYNPYAGHYQPYYGYNQFPGQGPPPSPRPSYPGQPPYGSMPGHGAPQQHPPFNPTPMSRSTSTASEARPESRVGQANTPMSQPPQPSQTPVSHQQQGSQSSNFVRPTKSKAIKITNDKGEVVNLSKTAASPSAPAQQPSAPVIVSTPTTATPPPRVPSSQHNRTDSNKPLDPKAAEATKNAFQEQVKKQMAEEKRKQEAEEAKTKGQDDTEAKATKEREDAEATANAEKVKEAAAEAEKAAASAADDKKAEDEAAAASNAAKEAEDEKARKEKEEDERLEREIAEMEAKEKEEEEREKAYQEKRAKEKAEKEKREAEANAQSDADLKRQEREAEERELAREREREGKTAAPAEGPSDEAKAMFASLKKPEIGPGASAAASAETSGAQTPAAEETSQEMPPPSSNLAQRPTGAQKPKPAHLKLETNKRVEPAEPTPGMQALKSARFLEVQEDLRYPEGVRSPNPALNQGGARKGRAYDKDFLLQFQSVFKEKPSVDWDQKVKETLGADEPGSARPQSARTPSGMQSRQSSGRPAPQQMQSMGQMGSFGGPMGGRTVPPGTTSKERFAASQMNQRPGGMAMPAPMGGRMPSNLGMGTPGVGMSRNNSLQQMGQMGGPGSPRQASSRGGKGASRRGGDRAPSKREEAEMASKMPLTANMDLKPLEKSGSGWKPTSIGQPVAVGPDPSGAMAPDMVQRKVKAALNKMTPEKFDKISDQILEIAGQSRNETDGRTLRQVIQLTFEKACDEAHWAGMYARFCHRMLTAMSGDIRDETIMDKQGNPVVGGALFRKYLLNRCQEEFERGWQANLPEKPEGETEEAALLSEEYYIAAAAKRRGLGLIQFIGQLYKLGMLTLRIMHECVMRLLNFEGEPDEAAVENLTTLLKSVGPTMHTQEQGRTFLDAYFQRIDEVLLKKASLPSRPRFMVMDLVDLRKAGWTSKDDAKGPKTIQQIHAEAEAAQQKAALENARTNQRGGGQGGRMPQGRGDARNFSQPPPVDYSRTTVGMDDLRRLQNRGQRPTGASLGPGGSLGPSGLNARTNSRRGNLGPGSSGNPSRTSTPPVEKEKKEEQTNAFSALADLDQGDSGERERAKSPAPTEKAPEAASNP